MSIGFGGVDNTWVRLKPLEEYGGLAGVFTTEAEWVAQGRDLDSLSMLRLGPSMKAAESGIDTGREKIPDLIDVLLNLHTRDEVQIVKIPANGAAVTPEVIVAGQFTDPHPPLWIQGLVQKEHRALLAVGPKGPSHFNTQWAWEKTWRVAVIGVTRQLTESGIGIVPAKVCSICGSYDPVERLEKADPGQERWELCGVCVREARRGRTERLAARSEGYRSEAEIAAVLLRNQSYE